MYIYKMNRNIMNNIFYKHIESLLDRNDLEINLFSGKTGLLLLYSTYKYKNESLIQNTSYISNFICAGSAFSRADRS